MYEPALNYTRTAIERADQFASWKRKDKAFFASGACHILAFMFKDLNPEMKLEIIYIKPIEKFGTVGTHVYVKNNDKALDFNGWAKEEELISAHKASYQKKFPGWDFEKVVIKENLETFCKEKQHRPPAHFAYLPWERTYKYIKEIDAKSQTQ